MEPAFHLQTQNLLSISLPLGCVEEVSRLMEERNQTAASSGRAAALAQRRFVRGNVVLSNETRAKIEDRV
jgi:hypothetical protein